MGRLWLETVIVSLLGVARFLQSYKVGLNWPMGPFTLLDYLGLDTILSITGVFQNEIGDPKYRPCPLLRQMVKACLLDRKTGKGFYD